MYRILHIVPALDSGGVENLLLNYYSFMDRRKFKFDFIVYGKEKGALEPTFEELGSKIYHIPPKLKAPYKSLKNMKKIICSNKYDIIHAHQNKMSFIPLYFAKRCGIKTRIAHSHLAYEPENLLQKTGRKIFSLLIKRYATHLYACGRDAGKYLYGVNAVETGSVIVLNNAIDVGKFALNLNVRNQKRKELNIDDKFVIGNVGRFSYQKNHGFLIQIFNEIYKQNKNVVLLLVGRGELEDDIRKQVKSLGLVEAVRFLGVRNDVSELLQAMDVFVLPSLYEGLPVVLVESQTAGLKSFAAKGITEEVKCTSLLEYISLEQTPQYWANEILKYQAGYMRKDTSEEIRKAGYDIKEEAKELELFYTKAVIC